LLREINSITKQQSDKNVVLESQIAELTMELKEKENEIQGLREGMQEMRLMYREQLDELLEEKALAAANSTVKETYYCNTPVAVANFDQEQTHDSDANIALDEGITAVDTK
jgi:alpha-N-acetylglucosamine transferase